MPSELLYLIPVIPLVWFGIGFFIVKKKVRIESPVSHVARRIYRRMLILH